MPTADGAQPGEQVGGPSARPADAGRSTATGGSDPAGADLVRSALADARAMSARRGLAGSDASGRTDDERRRRTRAANLRRRSPGYTAAGPDSADPQPLRAVMRSLFAERGWDRPVTEAQVFANWSGLVGEEIASHCTPVSLREGELRLTATSSAWATQIRLLGVQILGQLATRLGAGVVTRLTVSGPAAPSWRHGGRSVPGARGPRDTYG